MSFICSFCVFVFFSRFVSPCADPRPIAAKIPANALADGVIWTPQIEFKNILNPLTEVVPHYYSYNTDIATWVDPDLLGASANETYMEYDARWSGMHTFVFCVCVFRSFFRFSFRFTLFYPFVYTHNTHNAGTFQSPLDLHKFPFDEQSVKINIESAPWPITQLVFRPASMFFVCFCFFCVFLVCVLGCYALIFVFLGWFCVIV